MKFNLIKYQNKFDYITEFLSRVIYGDIDLTKWQSIKLYFYLKYNMINSLYKFIRNIIF